MTRKRKKQSKIPKIIIIILIVAGAVGLGLVLIDNKETIKRDINSDITEIKPQNQYNLFLQNEITPVKRLTGDIIKLRKVNSNLNRLELQDKINKCTETIDSTIRKIDAQGVNDNQKFAKENTISELNKLKYNLSLLSGASKKESFKTQGDKEIDKIFDDIGLSCSQIDDYIGVAEGINK